MNLHKSIAADAALEWLVELVYAIGHSPHIAPSWSAAAIAELEGIA